MAHPAMGRARPADWPGKSGIIFMQPCITAIFGLPFKDTSPDR